MKKGNYITVSLAIGLIIGSFIIQISRDNSLDYSVWIKSLIPTDEYIVGDYVLIRKGYFLNKELIKQIQCNSGDYLERFENTFFCNKLSIAKVLDYDKDNNKLPIFEYNGIIPDGYYFATGTHERSYDSRYFGLIKYHDVITKLYPIF